MSWPQVPADTVPFLSTEQMIEVDRAMIEDFGIILLQMMENAGRGLARLARERFLDNEAREHPVHVLAGPGGNGGGALVAARRLASWGARVSVYLATPPEHLGEVPRHQLSILDAMGVPVFSADEVAGSSMPELIVDGVLGYSLKGDPREGARTLIAWACEAKAPILSLDAPSGLDTSTGRVAQPAVRATATLTLALPKEGLRQAPHHVGELYLADISVPNSLYARYLNLDVPPVFSRGDVVRISLDSARK